MRTLSFRCFPCWVGHRPHSLWRGMPDPLLLLTLSTPGRCKRCGYSVARILSKQGECTGHNSSLFLSTQGQLTATHKRWTGLVSHAQRIAPPNNSTNSSSTQCLHIPYVLLQFEPKTVRNTSKSLSSTTTYFLVRFEQTQLSESHPVRAPTSTTTRQPCPTNSVCSSPA